jgi:hypothetical protein
LQNTAQKDKVWGVQADHYFNTNNFKLAAEYYGKTQRPFEEITLKFIAINENDALKTYLVHKLQATKQFKPKVFALICLSNHPSGCNSTDNGSHLAM